MFCFLVGRIGPSDSWFFCWGDVTQRTGKSIIYLDQFWISLHSRMSILFLLQSLCRKRPSLQWLFHWLGMYKDRPSRRTTWISFSWSFPLVQDGIRPKKLRCICSFAKRLPLFRTAFFSMLMVNWLFGSVVWIPGIPLYLLLTGIAT